jgi:hypothetical protein
LVLHQEVAVAYVVTSPPFNHPGKGNVMKNEITAMAIKGVLILQSLGLKCAIGYLRRRGFTPEQVVNILLRRTVC